MTATYRPRQSAAAPASLWTSSLRLVRTENDDDYIFTEDMYADYKEYALDESYAYCFPNYDAFAKAVRAELQLKSGRKRKSSDANPKRCYLGIKRKALVTEEQAED